MHAPAIETTEKPNPSTVQTRFNGLTHGATSKQTFIPGENPDDFYAMLYDCHRHHKPATIQESELVTNLVEAQWRLARVQRAHGENEYKFYTGDKSPETWTAEDMNHLNRFDRYKTSAERTLQRALANVLTIHRQKTRAHQWEQLHELQKRKFELQRQKFELAQAREQRMAELREIRQSKAANKGVSEIRSAKNAVPSATKATPAEPPNENLTDFIIPFATEIAPKAQKIT